MGYAVSKNCGKIKRSKYKVIVRKSKLSDTVWKIPRGKGRV